MRSTKYAGVTYRDGFKKSMIVSTASNFTRAAQLEANLVKIRGVSDCVDLVDFNSFLSICQSGAAR